MCCIVIKDNILQTEVAKGKERALLSTSRYVEIYWLLALVVDVHLKVAYNLT